MLLTPTAPTQAALSLKYQVIPGPTLAFVSQLTHFPQTIALCSRPFSCHLQADNSQIMSPPNFNCLPTGPPMPEVEVQSKCELSSWIPTGLWSQFLPSPTTCLPNLQHLIQFYSSELLQEPPSMVPPPPVLLSSGSFSPAVTNVTLTLSLGSSHLQDGVPVFSHGSWPFMVGL